jgi:hypothetical protein
LWPIASIYLVIDREGRYRGVTGPPAKSGRHDAAAKAR